MPAGRWHAALAALAALAVASALLAVAALGWWGVLLSAVAALVATWVSAAVLMGISKHCQSLGCNSLPGCAGGCRSCWVRRGSLARVHRTQLAGRIRQEDLRRSPVVRCVRQSQLVIRSRLGVAAVVDGLRVGLDLDLDHSPDVVVDHRYIVQEGARSSCCGSVGLVDHVGRIDFLADRLLVVRCRYKFR
jgi:hypothetical protein